MTFVWKNKYYCYLIVFYTRFNVSLKFSFLFQIIALIRFLNTHSVNLLFCILALEASDTKFNNNNILMIILQRIFLD